jgi:subtilisin family serine protease
MPNTLNTERNMSFDYCRAVKLAAVLGVGTVLAGCQDAVAPIGESQSYATVTSALQTHGLGEQKQLIKDQYIVVLRDGSGEVDAASTRLIRKTRGKINRTYKSGLRGFSAAMSAEEAAALSRDPAVAYVEQDQVITLGVGKPVSGGGGGGGGSKGGKGKFAASPADTGMITQTSPPSWGLDRIDQADLPLSNSYAYRSTGLGVHAYIVDSGIRISHDEFEGRATADFSAIDDGNGALDCNWHGTHVAGTVGGRTTGVAKQVKLHSVRVLDCGGAGTVSGLIAGLEWVASNRTLPAVANVSVLTAASLAVDEAVDRLVASGVTVVVAAGNNADDACGYSPARTGTAITVAATTAQDLLASFSNDGPCVDLAAPGQDIASSFYSSDFGTMPASGTSMASPHVAGAAALELQSDPAATPSVIMLRLIQSATATWSDSTAFALIRVR